MADKKLDEKQIFKQLEIKYRLLYMLRDLGIKSAHKPAVKSWTEAMHFLTDRIGSKAW